MSTVLVAGVSARRSPQIERKDSDFFLGKPSSSPSQHSMKSSVTANLMKTNPQYGIWQKKAQQAERIRAKVRLGLAVFAMCSLFALMLPLIIGYDDPSTSIELTAKETRLIEVQSNWYQTVDIKETRGEIITYVFKERPHLVAGTPLKTVEKFKLMHGQFRYWARYLHKGSSVDVKVHVSPQSFREKELLFSITRGVQSLNSPNSYTERTSVIEAEDFEETFEVVSDDDYYFIIERLRSKNEQEPHDVDFAAFLEQANGGDLEEEAAREKELVAGQVELSVTPFSYDVTYANDWERGNMIKDASFNEELYLVLTNPSMDHLATATITFQDRSFFLLIIFLVVEFLLGLGIAVLVEVSSWSCSGWRWLSPMRFFRRTPGNRQYGGFGMDSTMK